MTTEQKAPVRLADIDGPAGDCVRDVLAQQEQDAPLPRFVALRERRARRLRRRQSASFVVVTSTALLAAWLWPEKERPTSIRAEVVSEAQAPLVTSVATTARTIETPVIEAPVANLMSSKSPRSKAAIARTLKHTSGPVGTASAPEPAPPVPGLDPKGGAKACAQLAREGAAERALGCYEELAAGSGITAELAVFEQARLEGKLLRRPERALLRLDSYRRRFPNGSLRAEVMLAQIDWLVTTGNSARALAVVEEALASGLLRERSAELSRLRDQLHGAPR